MVKSLFFISLCVVVASCTDTHEGSTTHKPFDSSKFELAGYTERVHAFLNSRPEIKDQRDYRAIFVNTEDCSACIRGSFSEMYNFLEETQVPTFIYANDSTLELSVPPNEQVSVVYLPSSDFKDRDIFHRELYLYEARQGEFKSVYLDSRRKDSLNSLSSN